MLFFRHLCNARTAVAGALIVALAIAGCGRKGGLDPPPASSLVGPGAESATAPLPAPAGEPMVAVRRGTTSDLLVD